MSDYVFERYAEGEPNKNYAPDLRPRSVISNFLTRTYLHNVNTMIEYCTLHALINNNNTMFD